MAVSYEHLVWLMESLDKYNATLGDGITRYTFSAEYEAMREFVIDQMEEIGLSVNIDGFGNTFGTLETENTSLPPVYIGSHIDSVPRGGRFDGVLGVLAAIETARAIVLDSTRLTRPLVVVIFAEEEGGRFGQVMAGSRALVGRLSKKQLYELKDAQGITYEQALATHGYSNMPCKVLTPGSVHCMLEAHIEQSVVLERNRKTIGIVESIAGIQQSTMEVRGVANHAGATPMSMRQDALAATAEMISAIEKIGASNRSGRAVATVGRIDCLPNTSNVIPGFCRFALDVRDSDAQVLDEVVQTIYETCHNIAESRNVTLQIIASPRTPPVHLPENIKALLERSAISRHMPYMRLASGAVHDAAVMSHVTDVGMLFVPSKEGRSHVPEESTEYSDMYACTMILHDVVTALCR